MDIPQGDEELIQGVRNLLDLQDSRHGDHEARLARLEAQVAALMQAHIDLLRSTREALMHLQQTPGATPEGD